MKAAKHGRRVIVALNDGKTLMVSRWTGVRWEGTRTPPVAWFNASHPDAPVAIIPGVPAAVALPPGVI